MYSSDPKAREVEIVIEIKMVGNGAVVQWYSQHTTVFIFIYTLFQVGLWK